MIPCLGQAGLQVELARALGDGSLRMAIPYSAPDELIQVHFRRLTTAS
jgi:hypothetical protein